MCAGLPACVIPGSAPPCVPTSYLLPPEPYPTRPRPLRSGVRFGGDGFVEVLAATQTPTEKEWFQVGWASGDEGKVLPLRG